MPEFDKIKKNYDKKRGNHQKFLYKYYEDDPQVVPVYSRKPLSDLKSKYHTNLHTDFPGMIIDFKVGYMGRDIETTVDNNYSETEYEEIVSNIKEFEFNNNLASKDAESLKLSAISGLSHRLLYIKDGELRVKNIEGWKVVYEYTDDIYKAFRAYYFYDEELVDGSIEERLDIYDESNIYHLVKVYTNKKRNIYSWSDRPVEYEDEDGNIVSSPVEPHLLGELPIIPIENNKNWLGDFDKAVSTMDRYDEVLSDLISEIKSIRGNYLVIQGTPYTQEGPDGEAISVKRYLKENNLIVMPLDEDGKAIGDVKVLDINIPDEAIQNTLSGLRQHIFEESHGVDIKQLTETTDARVFTIKASLMTLENNAMTTESYFKQALRKQFRILAYFLFNSGETPFNYRDVSFTFNRNFPSDDQSKAQMLVQLINTMAPEDAYRQAGFENPVKLADNFKEENRLIE